MSELAVMCSPSQQPLPDSRTGPPLRSTDISSVETRDSLVYARDYDVDTRTGFMACRPPPARLPTEWKLWENAFTAATGGKLEIGDKLGLSEQAKARSRAWRDCIRQLPVLPTTGLLCSEVDLRRAHLILSWMLHVYVQTLPPDSDVRIPRSITIPLLQVSAKLDIPPVVTYSDVVLYNWALKSPSESIEPSLDNVCSQNLFTGTVDEDAFYMCSARIELRGVEALELMRITMDETFVGDTLAVHRITTYLNRIAVVLKELRTLLMDVRKNCDPETYYRDVRPWFRGEDSDPHKRKWVFEGIEDAPGLTKPTELSGPSNGQSSLIHVLDIFLGVDNHSSTADQPSFATRMQRYMPRRHREFLDHLASNSRPLRAFVLAAGSPALLEAYNATVLSLKEFRDAHMIIATLYIVNPARRAPKSLGLEDVEARVPLKGTGGTDLVQFLKGTRDRTKATLIVL